MSEIQTIEGEVTEQLGQMLEVHSAPVNLFRTDDPSEVVRRATAVAETLKKVLRDQNLISNISGREHVKVEGWTLCGTMLGVFPVCEWTHKLEDGWEARVEAKTLSGAVVGAAEASCLRSESNWAKRDDFALRSMAQTRATSKALRQPLGFIVALAGFEATPAEEMGSGVSEKRQEGTGRIPLPRSWAKLEEAVKKVDQGEDAWAIFSAFGRAAGYHLFGEADLKKLSKPQRDVMFQKSCSVYAGLMESEAGVEGPWEFWGVDVQRPAWAKVVEGTLLEIPDYSPPVPELSAEEQAEVERLAEEAISGPYS